MISRDMNNEVTIILLTNTSFLAKFRIMFLTFNGEINCGFGKCYTIFISSYISSLCLKTTKIVYNFGASPVDFPR
jgi:hypothetical protein